MRKCLHSAFASRGPELREVTGGQRVAERKRGYIRPGSHPNRCPTLPLAPLTRERGPQLGNGHFHSQIKGINLKEPSIVTGPADRDPQSWSGEAALVLVFNQIFPTESRMERVGLMRKSEGKATPNFQPSVTPTCHIATDFADIIKVAQLAPSKFMCTCWEVRKCW